MENITDDKKIIPFDKEFADIEKLFKAKDIENALKYYDEIRENAINAATDEERVVVEKKNKKSLPKIIALLLAALIVLGVIKLTVEDERVTESIGTYIQTHSIFGELNMSNLSRKIGQLVLEEKSNYVGEVPEMSILSQHTKRTEDDKGYYYENNLVAEDILRLDADIQEYALCASINDMGDNKNNIIDSHGHTNADILIRHLKTGYKEGENKDFFEDIETFNDYLVKKGYVDSKGAPSFDMFKNAMDDNAKIILEIVNARTEGQGAQLS